MAGTVHVTFFGQGHVKDGLTPLKRVHVVQRTQHLRTEKRIELFLGDVAVLGLRVPLKHKPKADSGGSTGRETMMIFVTDLP